MNRSVWKYVLEVTDKQTVQMPKNAQVLSVDEQGGDIVLYALVMTEAATEERTILIAGTGHPLPGGVGTKDFVGTVKLRGGALMFHVFAL